MSLWSPTLEWVYINDAFQLFYAASAAYSILQHNRAWEALCPSLLSTVHCYREVVFLQELDALRVILQAQRPFLSLLEELYIANKRA